MSTTVDARRYYGYLFQVDKRPTKLLDALLRGIADYIIEKIGDVTDKWLRPDKMAAFYRAVGGNYDSFFLNTPLHSISWIYAALGCQHVLLPTSDYFTPPSVPSLTKAGFVRWQCIEILLGPEEHVPFIQKALHNFKIRHPKTKERFPAHLPSEAFPLLPDPEIIKWHEECADKLRQQTITVPENEKPSCSSGSKDATPYCRHQGEEVVLPSYSQNLRQKPEAKHRSQRQNSPYISSKVGFRAKSKIQDDVDSEVHKVIVEVESTKSRRPKYKSRRENLRTGQLQGEEVKDSRRASYLSYCNSHSDEDFSIRLDHSRRRSKTTKFSPQNAYYNYDENTGLSNTKDCKRNSVAKEKLLFSEDVPEPICSVRYLS
ncbi:hypothetical protein GcM3_202019 [Golovinomyces cichoracearum]|uniref:DUF7514 domain-containing protein n=1 Tax=Golovinomyces cichoracearum TaxID=62708 RepID=A0A420HCZ1_9PEZI|nr:hypothetical protein GcM3_202019 [Golovinomyces cichoracearum]